MRANAQRPTAGRWPVDVAWFAPVVTIDGVSVAATKITGWKAANLDVLNIRHS